MTAMAMGLYFMVEILLAERLLCLSRLFYILPVKLVKQNGQYIQVFGIKGQEITLGASVGIAIYPNDGNTARNPSPGSPA